MYLVYEYHKNEISEGLEPLRSLEGVKLDLVKKSKKLLLTPVC